MKKAKSKSNKLRPEYHRSDFKKLERAKYYARVKASSNVVVLDLDLAPVFRNSEAVNKALRSLKASSKVVVLDVDLATVFPNSDAVNKALRSLVEVAEAVASVPSQPARPHRSAREAES